MRQDKNGAGSRGTGIFWICKGLVLVLNDLPQLDQRCLNMPEVSWKSNAIGMLDDGLDRCLFDPATRQFYLDVLSRFEVFVGHSGGSLPRPGNRGGGVHSGEDQKWPQT